MRLHGPSGDRAIPVLRGATVAPCGDDSGRRRINSVLNVREARGRGRARTTYTRSNVESQILPPEVVIRSFEKTAVIAMCCAVAGLDSPAADDVSGTGSFPIDSPSSLDKAAANFSGVQKIKVRDRSVNVSCSGDLAKRSWSSSCSPAPMMDWTRWPPSRRTLSQKNRVCSYDRLGEGRSTQPSGPQSLPRHREGS